MMKKMIYLLTGVSLACFAALSAQANYAQANAYAPSQINWLNSYEEAVKQSQMSSKPILILFTGTSWCPACMKLERDVLRRPEFAQAISQRFIFLKAEFPAFAANTMNTSPYRALAERYGIDAFPSIVVINGNGQQLFTVEYKAGGPEIYVQELNQKLGQGQSQSYSSQSYNRSSY